MGEATTITSVLFENVTAAFFVACLPFLFYYYAIGGRKTTHLSSNQSIGIVILVHLTGDEFLTVLDYIAQTDLTARALYDPMRVVILLIVTITMITLFDGKPIKALLAFMLSDAIMMPSYLGTFMIFSFVEKRPFYIYGMTTWHNDLFAKIITFILLYLLTIQILRKPLAKFHDAQIKNLPVLWAIIIFSYASIIFGAVQSIWVQSSSNMLWRYLFWFLLSACLLAIILQLNHYKTLKQDNYYLYLQKNLMLEHYQALENQISLSRQLQNEIDAYMNKTKGLLPEEELSNSSAANTPSNKLLTAQYSNNLILNTAIQNKRTIAEQNDITVAIEMRDVDISNYDEIDMLSLFYNLLDNAIESNLYITNSSLRHIQLKCINQENRIEIDISNATDRSHQSEKGFKTRKRDKKRHGIGLSIVKNIVGKYDGTIQFNEQNDLFAVSIYLKNRREG